MNKKLSAAIWAGIAVILICVSIYLAYADFPLEYTAVKTPFVRSGGLFNPAHKTFPNAKKNVDIYIPEYEVTEYEAAKLYAARFGMGEAQMLKGDDDYIFEKENEKLTVYRNIKLIEYESSNKTKDTFITKDEAKDTAFEVLNLRHLQIPEDEITVTLDEGKYTVTFAGTLGSLPNRAFPQTVIMDECGNVTKITYYSVKYKKIGSSKLKPVKEAYAKYSYLFENPGPEGNRSGKPEKNFINERDVRLIYIYQDSIVQAGYLLERKTETGETEEIKAAASKF
jgi:hypothetical protein